MIRYRDIASVLALCGLVAVVQHQLAFVGTFEDDLLVFRHYAPGDLLRSFWTDLAKLTSPRLWVPAYRPVALWLYAGVFEGFGFLPGPLQLARSGTIAAIATLWLAWLRLLGLPTFPALLCAASFVVFPVNFYAFAWSSELAALGSLVWLLTSLILHTLHVKGRAGSAALRAATVLWAAALLTSELVLPLIVLYPLAGLLLARPRTLSDSFRDASGYLVVAVVFVVVRAAVLGHVLPPDQTLADAVAGELAYARWMLLLAPAQGLPEVPAALFAVLALPLMLGLGLSLQVLRRSWVGVERETKGFAGRFDAALGRVALVDRLVLGGFVVTALAGLAPSFSPEPRRMFCGSLGAALIWGLAPSAVSSRVVALRGAPARALLAVLSAALLLGLGSVQVALARAPASAFVRLGEWNELYFYYGLGDLFARWDLREQARYLHQQLLRQGLIREGGEPIETAIRRTLRRRGLSPAAIAYLWAGIEGRPGAWSRFRGDPSPPPPGERPSGRSAP